MADQEVTVLVSAEVEGQEAVEKFAKMLEGLDGETVQAVLAIEAAKAQGELEQVLLDLAEMDGTEAEFEVKMAEAATLKGDLDDLKTKITEIEERKAEIVVEGDTSQAVTALEDVASEAKELDGLKPEITPEADTTQAITALEDAEAEAKQLDGLKPQITPEVDTSRMQKGLGTARGNVDDLSDSARGANSALANMVGNAAQDVGVLGGIAGSAGVAIGQMAEYASDATLGGEKLGSALKSMAKVAGPIAAITVAIQLMSSVMGEQKAKAEANAEAVDNWVKAMAEGGDAASNLTEIMRDQGGVMSDTTDVFDEQMEVIKRDDGFWGSLGKTVEGVKKIFGAGKDAVQDISPLIDEAGLSVLDFNRAAADGERGMDRWTAAVENSNLSAEEKDTLLSAMEQSQTQYNEAVTEGERNERIFALATDEATDALKRFNQEQDPVADMPATWDLVANAIERMNSGLDPTRSQMAAINTVMDVFGMTQDQVFTQGNKLLDERATKQRDVNDALNEADAANKEAAANQQLVADAMGNTAEAAAAKARVDERGVEAIADYNAALDEETAKLEEEKSALEGAAEALLAKNDAIRAATDSQFALHDAERDAIQAQKDFATILENPKAGLYAIRDAQEAVVESAVKVADSQVRIATEQAAARGETLSSVQAIDTQNKSLAEQAATMEGPALLAMENYIAEINNIPAKRESEILALLDQGKVREAEALINETSRTRDAAIKADADKKAADDADKKLNDVAADREMLIKIQANTAETNKEINDTSADRSMSIGISSNAASQKAAIDEAAADRNTTIYVSRVERPLGEQAANGTTNSVAGTYLVGERGPELVALPRHSKVYTASKTRQIVGRRASGTTGNPVLLERPRSVNLTINASVIGNRFDVMRTVRQALKESERLNGTRRYA